MRIKTGDQAIDDPEEFWEDSIGRALDKFVEGRGLDRAAKVLGLSKSECEERLELLKNCGTGAGGFQPGNTCARGGDGGREESLRASGLDKLPAEKTSAPSDLAKRLTEVQAARGISRVAGVSDSDAASAVHHRVYEHTGKLVGTSESTVTQEDGRKFVRREYLYEKGRMTVDRDENNLLLHVYHKGSDGKEREILKFRIRDRRLDGTAEANAAPLTDWFYDGQVDAGGEGSVEFSLYSRGAGTFWTDAHPGEHEFEEFLSDPFKLMSNEYKERSEDIPEVVREKFMSEWQRAFDNAGLAPREGETRHPDARAPAQNSLPDRGSGKAMQDRGEEISRSLGYERVDNVPSWYNVAVFLEKNGYKYKNQDDFGKMQDVKNGLRKLNDRRESDGQKRLTPLQESWVVLLQFGRKYGYNVPREYDLGGPVMPLSMGHNLWMQKGLR